MAVNNWVIWDMPGIKPKEESRIARPQGVPRSKVQLIPTPLRPVLQKLALLEKALADGGDFEGIEGYNTVQSYCAHLRTYIMSRVIGRSLTRAPPGHAFDILLGNYLA